MWDEIGEEWHTGARALLAFDPSATHHVVIQDDAIPCRDFRPGIEAALSAVPPDTPVGFYIGYPRPRIRGEIVQHALDHAIGVGSPWITYDGPIWGVCNAFPTSHLLDLVSWGDKHPEILEYDTRIEAYYQERGIKCWYTVPSLVDHRREADSPSLLPHYGDRYARHYIGDQSSLDIDWHQEPVSCPVMVVMENPESGERRIVQDASGEDQALAVQGWRRVA